MIMKWFRNIGRKQEIEQEKRINAEMAYRAQEREFRQYDKDLEDSIRKFKRMACEAADEGQRANALRAARFVNKMTKIREKVISVKQHFEMLHSLSTIGDIMVRFMDTCRDMGCDFSKKININALSNGQMDLETGLNKLSFITECVEQAFEKIEDSLGSLDIADEATTEEDEKLLEELLAQRSVKTTVQPEVAPVEIDNGKAVSPGITQREIQGSLADEVSMNAITQRLEEI